MNPKKPLSLQDIRKRRQEEVFVGRESQVSLFRRNWSLPLDDYRRSYIFNVFGQGGVGKTSLLNRYRNYVDGDGSLAAWTDETEKDVPAVMERLAAQLEEQGYSLKSFSERYKVYRQRRQELETDPEAPQGFAAAIGRTIAKVGLGLAKSTPANLVVSFLDEDALATQAGEWANYVARKLTNKDEVRLLQEPIEVLTPLFLKDLQNIADDERIALFFDTYERTFQYLDGWLINLINGRYGSVPAGILWVIAGRDELDKNRWSSTQDLIARVPLESFSEDEARLYLNRKDISDERVIEVILNLSDKLPILVAVLADESPDDPNRIGDPSGTAVDRFLKWVDEPERRQVALDAAIPRRLNRDILAVLVGEEHADKFFTWLKDTPFVQRRTDGWFYHDVVRTQMVRHKHQESPQNWTELHERLARYYEGLKETLGLAEIKSHKHPLWQLYTIESVYHRLCQAHHKYISLALSYFLEAAIFDYSYVHRLVEAIKHAEREMEIAEGQQWGSRLEQGLKAIHTGEYKEAAEMYTALINRGSLDEQSRITALRWRAYSYLQSKRLVKAIGLHP
ncbi:MAG TPA: hypothetical protein VF131_18620 [Blastocatellia bacterium]|nr:hypothetical protein [Blastocatellia bacterium]